MLENTTPLKALLIKYKLLISLLSPLNVICLLPPHTHIPLYKIFYVSNKPKIC